MTPFWGAVLTGITGGALLAASLILLARSALSRMDT